MFVEELELELKWDPLEWEKDFFSSFYNEMLFQKWVRHDSFRFRPLILKYKRSVGALLTFYKGHYFFKKQHIEVPTKYQ